MIVAEACRVYVGSFNGGAPIRTDINPQSEQLFRKEQDDLMEVRSPFPACDYPVEELCQ